MKRREFIRFLGGVGLAAVLLAAFSTTLASSQPPDKPRRVGALGSERRWRTLNQTHLERLVDGLREHGWEDGRNLVLEGRFAGPDPARFPDLAKELVALKVDVIVAANMQAIEAARRATATIPIIMAAHEPGRNGLRGLRRLARAARWQRHRRGEPSGKCRRQDL